METSAHRPARPAFDAFYADHFCAEHRRSANRALHVLGVLLGLAWLPLTLFSPLPWLVLLWPAVHVAPGLIGHRIFERSEAVGDLRVNRSDFSPFWFLAANHRMAFELLLGRWTGDRKDG